MRFFKFYQKLLHEIFLIFPEVTVAHRLKITSMIFLGEKVSKFLGGKGYEICPKRSFLSFYEKSVYETLMILLVKLQQHKGFKLTQMI